MQPSGVADLMLNVLIVLAAGMVAGVACKRLGVSMLVGYLVVGTILGAMGFGPQAVGSREMQYLAQAGVLLLLFSIGIEFSLEDLLRSSRDFFVGGGVQMVLSAVPILLIGWLFGVPWPTAVLIGSASAISSTVLVFKALEEWGQSASPHGRRAVGILLFQDITLVPLLLLLPVLSGGGLPGPWTWGLLALKSVLFVGAVAGLRLAIARWAAPFLAELRSVELLVVFALILLGGSSLAAYWVGLPPAMGALAAGIMLNGNRLSGQFDALTLPFRETFAAVFFVSLGSLARLDAIGNDAVLVLGGLAGVLAVKIAAGTVALRLLEVRWKAALGMGLGLAPLSELSFVLLSAGLACDLISPPAYNRMLFIALGTLILTPQLLKAGLGWAESEGQAEQAPAAEMRKVRSSPLERAVVVGAGPIGGQVASQLEIRGMDVCLVDLSPVNLHPFAQQGFRTIAGDGSEAEVLRRADIEHCRLAAVTVPHDASARSIVATIRALNPACTVVVRCRYQANVGAIRRAGAATVISEEAEAAGALLRLLEQMPPVPASPGQR